MPESSRLPPISLERSDAGLRQTLLAAPGGPMNITLTLAHHPSVLTALTAFGRSLTVDGTLSPRKREFVILRTAVKRRAEYEWAQHVVRARRAGITDSDIQALQDDAPPEHWAPDERALVAAVDELHDDGEVTDKTWTTLRSAFTNQQLIEVVLLVGMYDMLAYVIHSFGVSLEPDVAAQVPGLRPE